jgi:hypothetical protein
MIHGPVNMAKSSHLGKFLTFRVYQAHRKVLEVGNEIQLTLNGSVNEMKQNQW